MLRLQGIIMQRLQGMIMLRLQGIIIATVWFTTLSVLCLLR